MRDKQDTLYLVEVDSPNSADETTAPLTKSEIKAKKKHIETVKNMRTPATDYEAGDVRAYQWKNWQLYTVGVLILIIMVFCVFTAPMSIKPFEMLYGFEALAVKNGATLVGEGENASWDYSGAQRTITVDPSTYSGDALKELAYALYQTGNMGMMIAPSSAYYSTGYSDALTLGATLPLLFNLIDVRDNTNGAGYRTRFQTLDPDKELGLLGTIMSGFDVVVAERRYYEAGYSFEPNVIYERIVDAERQGNFDWSKASGYATSSDRYDRSVAPIPYVSAAYQGSDADLRAALVSTEYGIYKMTYQTLDSFFGALSIGGQNYADIFGADAGDILIPVYKDCQDFAGMDEIYEGYEMGRMISYEKTDQHVYFNSTENTEYNDIKTASVEYVPETSNGANDGYYKVSISVDCTADEASSNNYASADTCWALRDSQGSSDNTANFTKIDITFELWDNGYFKQWEMWEDWHCTNAKGIGLEMGATQYYKELFTYNSTDCDLQRFDDFWTAKLKTAEL